MNETGLSRHTFLGAAVAGIAGAVLIGTDSPAVAADVLPGFPEWDWARGTFDRYDSSALFRNGLLDQLMPRH